VGYNRHGELGDGTITNSDVPVAVGGLSAVTAISAGTFHSLALLSGGTVMAWGENVFGQLGTGTTGGPETCIEFSSCSRMPVATSGLSGVAEISAGGFHNAFLLSNGTVMTDGDNQYGELGDGTISEHSDVPVEVTGLSGVAAVSSGGLEDTMALLSSGVVDTWGINDAGKLGNGTTINSDVPVEVIGLSGMTAISAGYNHNLAYGPG
jgi:alpha-tubulin suppressor-like RCC1 family protein